MLVGLFPERGLQLRFDTQPAPAGYLQSKVSRGSLDTEKTAQAGLAASHGTGRGLPEDRDESGRLAMSRAGGDRNMVGTSRVLRDLWR